MRKNSKVVHIDYEEKMSLEHAVDILSTIVSKLKTDKSVNLTFGEQTHQVTPSSQVELEVKLEEHNGKHKLEIELEWIEGQESHGLQVT